MGRRKLCTNIGKVHEYEQVFPSIGGWHKGQAIFRSEMRCRICSHRIDTPETGGIWVPDNMPNDLKLRYKRMPNDWFEDTDRVYRD